MSTNNKIKYGTHPLTNISLCGQATMKKNIGDDITPMIEVK